MYNVGTGANFKLRKFCLLTVSTEPKLSMKIEFVPSGLASQVEDLKCTSLVEDLKCTSQVEDLKCTSQVEDLKCTSQVEDLKCTSQVKVLNSVPTSQTEA